MNPDHLIFLHLPKTAGSSLHNIIERQYRKKEMINFVNVNLAQDFAKLDEASRNKIKVLKGHVAYGIHEYFTQGSFEYFTMLREPISRVLSTYYHIGREKTHYFYEEFRHKKYSLLELAESGKILNFNNCMVRFLSGEPLREYDKCDEQMLELALKNISTFPLVGIQEHFDEFLFRLMDRYGWKNPYHRRRRVSPTPIRIERIDPITRSYLEHLNRLDIELYRIVRERVLAEEEKLQPQLSQRVARFRKRNDLLNKFTRFLPERNYP